MSDDPMTADAQQVERLRELLAAGSPHKPWTLTSEDPDRGVSLRQNLDYGPDIAAVEFDGDPESEFDEQAMANFRLIAEAITALPDLLATAEAHAALVKAVEGLAESLHEDAQAVTAATPEALARKRAYQYARRAILAATDTAADGAR